MKSKSLILQLALCALTALSCAEIRKDQKETTRYYLVRHAEKAADGTEDPDLSPAGQARAQKLVSMLKENKIEGLYATSYKRTRQTLQPLADTLHLEISTYNHRDAKDVERLIHHCKGKTVVIAGHSNSIPQLANILIGDEIYEELDESEYTRMWEIILTGNQVTGHKVITY
jgi:2,3-bisphosphoglycerate-dependent phosphoglycerate mutase